MMVKGRTYMPRSSRVFVRVKEKEPLGIWPMPSDQVVVALASRALAVIRVEVRRMAVEWVFL